MHKISAMTLEGAGQQVPYDYIPDRCPLCHTSVFPKVHFGIVKLSHNLQVLYQCTNTNCAQCFIGWYTYDLKGIYRYRRSDPKSPPKVDVPEPIREISPTFVEVYKQALASEAFKLSQLTGIGLRKALEFLVKDFAISRIKGDENEARKKEEKIRAMFLGKCIDEYIDDSRLKATATRANWLGNDEAHYIRRWDDKDIEDLKVLIKLTKNWIENIILTDEYTETMASN